MSICNDNFSNARKKQRRKKHTDSEITNLQFLLLNAVESTIHLQPTKILIVTYLMIMVVEWIITKRSPPAGDLFVITI